MDARLDYGSSEILQKFVKHINSAGAAVPRGPCRSRPRTWC